ncbi:tetratricopeptide repeat protein 36 isoform X2 [Anolis carolinensis]|uniref:tetratricopeptide repeat protein 36 isoform X2 n=1 Tax=Anolis carolinensis TaxID=28377 RepID=UPI002F2B294A
MASAKDRAVLQSILHPNTPFDEEESEDEEPDAAGEEEGAFDPDLLKQATDLEVQGVAWAEAGDLEAALEAFGEAILLLPGRASAYNNRAQALRLKGDTEGALRDLEAALSLSGGSGPAARQGFVQRGLIRLWRGQEEAARGDFAEAARLGSPFARQQLVRMNPYAALCNRMLSEVMKQLQGPPKREEGPLPNGTLAE